MRLSQIYRYFKKLKIRLNGNSTQGCFISFRGNESMSLKSIFERITQKMNFSYSDMKKLRLFNSDGLEIYDEDVKFLQSKDTLYISLG